MKLALLAMLSCGCARIFGLDPPRIGGDAATDGSAALMCQNAGDCSTPGLPFCDVPTGLCVACLANTNCPPNMPFCSSTTHTCAACVLNSDCTSGVCQLDGTCGSAASTIYVDGANGTDTGSCTQPAPCKTITFALSVAAGRTILKLGGAIDDNVSISGSSWIWYADPGTKLVPVSTVPTFSMQSGADVTIVGLHVVGSVNSTTINSSNSTLRLHRVLLDGSTGKLAMQVSGGALDIFGSTIANNPGGGIQTDSATAFDIENTFIVHNGSATTAGGAYLGASSSGNNRFEFNTVVDNVGKGDVPQRTGGVGCQPGNTLALANNIIARNGGNNTTPGACDFTQSLVQTDTSGLAFVSDSTAPLDYHLTAASKAIDTARASTIANDFDGEHRPYGAGYDYGADEYVP